ncbi:MAG: hypothetical protein ACI4OY_02960, partial [Aristaeellaceae bacterium]
SQMTGEELRQALCELSAPLCAILQDEAVDALLAKVTDTSLPLSQVTALLIGQGIPLLLDRHAEDTCAALAILTGYTADTLRGMNALALIRLVKEAWDGELAAFFGSAGSTDRATS